MQNPPKYTLCYIGRNLSCIIVSNDCETSAIRYNLKRGCQIRRRISKIIAKEEVAPKVARMFYQAVVVVVLLYGRETWSITEAARRPLDGFYIYRGNVVHHQKDAVPREARGKEKWAYSHSADVLTVTGPHILHHCIDKHQINIYKTTQSRPILLGCMGSERLEGTPRRLCWWQQTLDYIFGRGGEREEAGPTGSLDSPMPPAWCSPPIPPPPPAATHRRPCDGHGCRCSF